MLGFCFAGHLGWELAMPRVGQAVLLLSHMCRHHILVGAYTFVVLTLILSDILPRQAVAFMLCYPTRLLISSHANTRGRVTGSLLQL
jgi:hypothetical protein